jgi:hypothetical protein
VEVGALSDPLLSFKSLPTIFVLSCEHWGVVADAVEGGRSFGRWSGRAYVLLQVSEPCGASDRGAKNPASVSTQLPPIVWFVVIAGSALNLSLMWLFVVDNKRLHDLLTTILACLLGLLAFLLAVMDLKFRGKFFVGHDAFEMVYPSTLGKNPVLQDRFRLWSESVHPLQKRFAATDQTDKRIP